jgi:hypothetical protein
MSDPTAQQPQALLAETWYLARLMLADRPDIVDLLVASEHQELLGDPNIDRFVLELRTSDEIAYVVADHGTRTTLTDLPDWATDADVHVVDLRDVGDEGWKRFEEVAQALREAAPSLYNDLRVGDTVAAVAMYHESAEYSAMIRAGEIVHVVRDNVDELLMEPGCVERWAEEAIGRVRHEFDRCRLPIHPAAPAIATLVVILNLPDPRRALAAGLLRAVRPDIGEDDSLSLTGHPEIVAQFVADYPFPQGAVGIMLEPGFYALELELAGHEGLRSAWSSSLYLADVGQRILDEARATSSIELFYLGLGEALLHYRAADAIAEFFADYFASAGRESPEVEAHRVLCEERRVTLLGAFYSATSLDPRVQPTSFPSLRRWIDYLAAMPLDEAVALVHDHALRLVFPRFVRDIVLGGLFRRVGRANASVESLMRAYEALELDRNRNAQLPTEPNFLVLVTEELAEAHHTLGDAATAARMRERAAAVRGDQP